MKRRNVIGKIADEARKQGLAWTISREGGNHTLYDLDGLMIPIARHNEIDDYTAQKIFKECEPKLGSRWWK